MLYTTGNGLIRRVCCCLIVFFYVRYYEQGKICLEAVTKQEKGQRWWAPNGCLLAKTCRPERSNTVRACWDTRRETARDGFHGHCEQWRSKSLESGEYKTTTTCKKRGSEA